MVPEQGPQDQSPQPTPEQGGGYSPPPGYPPRPEQPPQYQQQYQSPQPPPPQQQYQQQPPPHQYQQQPPPYPPPGRPRQEKGDEKQGEKEQEKRQEKGQGLDEKYHRNPLGFIGFALLVIWFGITLLLGNVGVYDNVADPPGTDGAQWAVFFWGGGVLILLEVIVRLLVPRFRRSVVGSIVWGAIWLGIGFGLWYGEWEVIGPIVIIAVGVAILLGRVISRR